MKQFLDTFSKTNIAHILGVIIVVGCFIQLYLLTVKEIPASNKDVVNVAVGFVLGGALSGVVGYFYGASKGSSKKTDNE